MDAIRKRAKRRRKFFMLVLLLSESDDAKHVENRIWQRDWLAARDQQSAYYNILQELRLEDAENYRKYLRMNVHTFQYLLEKVRPPPLPICLFSVRVLLLHEKIIYINLHKYKIYVNW